MKLSRPLIIIIGPLVFFIALTVAQIYYLKSINVDLMTKIILFGVMTFNIVALLTLIFFTVRGIYKLSYEKRKKIHGHRFKTKLSFLLVIFAMIPSVLMFVTASGLTKNFIDNLFAPHRAEQLVISMEVARDLYDLLKQQLLLIAEEVSRGQAPFAIPNLTIRKVTRSSDMPEIINDAFKGQKGVDVLTTKEGDLIRAVVPAVNSKNYVIVVEYSLPSVFTSKVERLREINEEYAKTLTLKEPMRINYLLILSFVTLMIVFTGLWFAIKISTSITNPIKELVIATERVKAGDLSVRVYEESDDELGLLIESFNNMVTQLKNQRDSLEYSYHELDRRRLYLENILEKIQSGVIFIDYDGTIKAINRSALSFLKLDRDPTGLHYRELLERLNSDDLNHMVRGIQGRRYRSLQKQVKVDIDGESFTVNVYISDIVDSKTNTAIGILVVFEDLTEFIKAQKALAWQEVARRIAHEIKNPLTPIKLSSERLLKKWHKKDPDFERIFEGAMKTIINEVESLKRLVDEFSRYGRLPELIKTKTNLVNLIEETIALYKGFKDIQIVLSSEDIPDVTIDSEQMKRVFMNLIDNAIKAMNNKGTLSISITCYDNAVKIEFADTGIGIREKDKDRLFIPYFTASGGGTGLGLAISNKIVTDHGGKITAKSNPSGGSIFCIELPLENSEDL